MSATPEDLVNIEVDGRPVQAKKGAMIIHVTDAIGEYVPRFCYHEKLPIAANCRMCLVEVEKAPKPLPACATPVAEGMKVFTRSPAAIGAQKATMEFLLINHPLDCPICDQGGECELQDLAMGFGRDIARFNERKRVVKDKNLGPLVSTDMTRCIHCTRCVRFGADIAGIPELGTTDRGENMQIGTYIERSVEHELSGNIIDLCPVGALNSKPFRYQGRSWEMTESPLVAAHDGFGSNLFGHVLRGKLKRVVPRPNDEVNETWISDRDRFSYEGLLADDRLLRPMVRKAEGWCEVDWEEALKLAAEQLKTAGGELGVLVHPSSTTEEAALAAQLAESLGTANIDHRLRQRDFRDAAADPRHPTLGMSLAAVDSLSGVLIVGSHLRSELPLLAHRVRKAVVRGGAQVAFIDAVERHYHFPVAAQCVADPNGWVHELACILRAVCESQSITPPASVAGWLHAVEPTAAHRAAASAVLAGERRAVWLGAMAVRHPAYADLRALASELARLCSATMGELAEGANAAGAWLAGAVPHRRAGGLAQIEGRAGRNTRDMLAAHLPAYLLIGAIEPDRDLAEPALAEGAFAAAQAVIAITPYASESLKAQATVLLPMAAFAETSGSYVNLEGRWQSQTAAARAPGEARPGWKILRVLGNLVDAAGFDFESSEAVCARLQSTMTEHSGAAVPLAILPQHVPPMAAIKESADIDLGDLDVPMYDIDAVLRRSPALQATTAAQRARGER
jgi:NADH-quinone oxidoreductase subunit G